MFAGPILQHYVFDGSTMFRLLVYSYFWNTQLTLLPIMMVSFALASPLCKAEPPAVLIRVGALPFRGEALSASLPVFPASAMAGRLSGKVIAELACGVDGKAQRVSILESSHKDFASSTEEALMKWRINRLKIKDGRAAQAIATLVFYFTYENDRPVVIDAAARLLNSQKKR